MTCRSFLATHLFVRATVFVLASLLGGLSVHAQSAAAHAPNPDFSVTSVKPGDPSVRRGSLEYRPEVGEFDSNSATLDQLIGFAYDVRAYQIVGGPKWRDTASFTIDAKAESPIPSGPASTQIFRTMVQALLAKRFQLVVRQETRDAPVYELVVDKNGSKLKEGTEATGGIRMETGQLIGMAAPMFLLVNQLSRQLGRTVIDKTGLLRKYDFTLRWEPDSGPAGSDTPLLSDSPGPSIFTAVQDDLGLKLQPTKGPVKFIVIDRLEKPDAN
jgi:uncharacterized protein (TIGR03435 family)